MSLELRNLKEVEWSAQRLFNELSSYYSKTSSTMAEYNDLIRLNHSLSRAIVSDGKHLFQEISCCQNLVEKIKTALRQKNRDVFQLKDLISTTKDAFLRNRKDENERIKHLIKEEINLTQELSTFEQKLKSCDQHRPISNKNVSSVRKATVKRSDFSSLPKDVVEYEKFLALKGGRNGGWTDFDHAVFLRIRRRFYPKMTENSLSDEEINEKLNQTDSKNSSNCFNKFIKEVCSTLLLNNSSIAQEHEKWWTRLQQLKSAKRRAVIAWRKNKAVNRREDTVISKPEYSTQTDCSGINNAMSKSEHMIKTNCTVTDSTKSETEKTARRTCTDDATPVVVQHNHFAPKRTVVVSRSSQEADIQRKNLAEWRERKLRDAEEKLTADFRILKLQQRREELGRKARMTSLRSQMEKFLIKKREEIAKRDKSIGEHKTIQRSARNEINEITSISSCFARK